MPALKLCKSESLDDWFTIERAEHDGRHWMEPTEYGSRLCYSGRVSDACVEGPAAHMLGLAAAILQRGRESFKRCAVDATKEPVKLWSPRNSERPGECSYAEAEALARAIVAELGLEAAAHGAEAT